MTSEHHLVVAYLILLIFLPVLAFTVEIETHHYLEKTGSKTTPVEWKFEKGDLPKLTWLGADETITTWHSPSLKTVKWLIDKPGQNTHITAQRINNDLVINGVLNSCSIDKKGILSVFGECYYWFKKDNGLFVKYEGPGTKSGEKVTVEIK